MKILFMGTPDFSVPILEQLIEDGYNIVAVVTQPNRPKGRKKIITPSPVKITAEQHGLPVFQPEKLKDDYEQVLHFQADLIVTAAYGQIVPRAILEAPKYGCINVHASLLPEYRGGAPIHQAIIDGKEKTGVTIMYMVDKLDAGDILTQVEIPIEEDDHVGSMHHKLSVAGAKLLSDTIPSLIDGKLEAVRQEEDKATFAANIKREQERIDWTQSGEAIYNQIRGLHPWPVAFTYYNGKPFKVWWGMKIPIQEKAEPGRIIAFEDDGFLVATGNKTAIKITDCQPSGKKRMSASQLIQGRNISVGEKLGVRDE